MRHFFYSKLLSKARTRTRTTRNLTLADLGISEDDDDNAETEVDGSGKTVVNSKSNKADKVDQKKSNKKSVDDLKKEEEASIEGMRIELIHTVSHTVILEAASNGQYLTLQDFFKVVQGDTEYFSHLNLYM